MRISVLIPTLGREKEPIDTVRALQRQSVRADEIIVVDQNQPEIPGLTRALAEIPGVRHLRFETKGVSLNYNRLLAAAVGEIVLFLDDDVVLGERLIEKHLGNYAKDPRVGGVAGRVEQPSGDLPPERIRHVGVYHPWSGTLSSNFNGIRRAEVQTAPGGNMSFRREILLREDGFDLGFAGNGYFFETDMSLRVWRAGHRLVFEPEATLKHLMAPAGGARVGDKSVHTYFYARNGVRLFRRHSPKAAHPWITARLAAYVAAKAVYNLSPRILIKGWQGIWSGWKDPLGPIGLSSALQKEQK